MTPKSRGLVDIGIGRLPVRTSEEAKAVVDKIRNLEKFSVFSGRRW